MPEYAVGTEVLGSWRITREIGEGATGRVFEVEKTGFGIAAKSALKVMRIPPSDSIAKSMLSEGMDKTSVSGYFREVVDDFAQEIALLSELSNPGIVAYQDHDILPHDDGIGYDVLLRMELLEPLTARMEASALPEAEVARLGAEVAAALVYCHECKVIHRDIKPGNIFIDREGRFKLGDFGVSRTVEHTVGSFSHKGTEAYMAPEQFKGYPYGADVDVYALGLVMYQLLNGNRLPFLPPSPTPISFHDREQAKTRRLSGEPVPPIAGCDPNLFEVVAAACSPNPAMRPSAAKLYGLLKRLKHAEYASSTADSPETNNGNENRRKPSGSSANTTSQTQSTVGVWDVFEEESDTSTASHESFNQSRSEDFGTAPSPVFPRNPVHKVQPNGDVTMTVLITQAQARAGAEILVPNGTGALVKANLRADIQDGNRVRFRRQGTPTPSGAIGDLYTRIRVVDCPTGSSKRAGNARVKSSAVDRNRKSAPKTSRMPFDPKRCISDYIASAGAPPSNTGPHYVIRYLGGKNDLKASNIKRTRKHFGIPASEDVLLTLILEDAMTTLLYSGIAFSTRGVYVRGERRAPILTPEDTHFIPYKDLPNTRVEIQKGERDSKIIQRITGKLSWFFFNDACLLLSTAPATWMLNLCNTLKRAVTNSEGLK